MNTLTGMRLSRPTAINQVEALESRLLLASVNLGHYLPLRTGSYWEYDTETDGQSVSGLLSVAREAKTIRGEATTRIDVLADGEQAVAAFVTRTPAAALAAHRIEMDFGGQTLDFPKAAVLLPASAALDETFATSGRLTVTAGAEAAPGRYRHELLPTFTRIATSSGSMRLLRLRSTSTFRATASTPEGDVTMRLRVKAGLWLERDVGIVFGKVSFDVATFRDGQTEFQLGQVTNLALVDSHVRQPREPAAARAASSFFADGPAILA